MPEEKHTLSRANGSTGRTAAAAEHAAGWRPSGPPRRLTVLGATGSIGSSTLDLVARNPDAFEIVALTANGNVEHLAELAIRHRARFAAIADPACYAELAARLAGSGTEAAAGPDSLVAAATVPADCVMAAIVGAAGLEPTFAAVRQGRRVALANKECLVTAGSLFMAEVAAAGTELLPVDSEHSGVFQAIATADPADVEKITLTASGGPFRTWDMARLAAATPAEALQHPNWSMGPKITVDSATMMNKGLEVIEAFYLFPGPASRLDVVVHPQSIVHCLVSFRDGSVLAQLSNPDMRTPIALSLSYPARMPAPTGRLDLVGLGALTFEAPDPSRFPALGLARAALERGLSAPAVLSAANEVAVDAFLAGQIGFLDIAATVATCLDQAERDALITDPKSLGDALEVDRRTRILARNVIGRSDKAAATRHAAEA
jgi:1-deoxy-D-xylulose-5-phosphate reductoisomerase